jgi:hypothetical protein
VRRLIHRCLILLTAIAVCHPAAAADSLPTQTSSQAGVTLVVTPRNLSSAGWEFEIALNTHSQDLKDDLLRSAVLISDGRKMIPVAWQGDPPGGHHRKGVLRFDPPAGIPARVELRIQRPGEPDPRVFRW